MKKENLNNKKQEWVTSGIKKLTLDDNEGKEGSNPVEGIFFTQEVGPSWPPKHSFKKN